MDGCGLSFALPEKNYAGFRGRTDMSQLTSLRSLKRTSRRKEHNNIRPRHWSVDGRNQNFDPEKIPSQELGRHAAHEQYYRGKRVFAISYQPTDQHSHQQEPAGLDYPLLKGQVWHIQTGAIPEKDTKVLHRKTDGYDSQSVHFMSAKSIPDTDAHGD